MGVKKRKIWNAWDPDCFTAGAVTAIVRLRIIRARHLSPSGRRRVCCSSSIKGQRKNPFKTSSFSLALREQGVWGGVYMEGRAGWEGVEETSKNCSSWVVRQCHQRVPRGTSVGPGRFQIQIEPSALLSPVS